MKLRKFPWTTFISQIYIFLLFARRCFFIIYVIFGGIFIRIRYFFYYFNAFAVIYYIKIKVNSRTYNSKRRNILGGLTLHQICIKSFLVKIKLIIVHRHWLNLIVNLTELFSSESSWICYMLYNKWYYAHKLNFSAQYGKI